MINHILKQIITNYKMIPWLIVVCLIPVKKLDLNNPTYLGYFNAYKYGIVGMWSLLAVIRQYYEYDSYNSYQVFNSF